MRKVDGVILYDSFEEQYRLMGVPSDKIRLEKEFTIFNLANLQRLLPFSLHLSRLNFFLFGFIKEAVGNYTIDSKNLHQKMLDVGNQSKLILYEDQVHNWPLANIHSKASKKLLRDINEFLN